MTDNLVLQYFSIVRQSGLADVFRTVLRLSRSARIRRDSLVALLRISAACLIVPVLAGRLSTVAAQTAAAPVQGSGGAPAEGREPSGAEQDGVTISDHFKTFADSTFATVGGAIVTVGAPLGTTSFSQLFTSHAGFGNDGNGFGYHYGINLVGNVSGKFLGKFALPAVFRQDERYERAEFGSSPARRLGHIVRHVVVTRSADHNHNVFNASAVPNSLLTAALSNAYQPPEQRTAADSAARFGYNVLGFVLGDAYTEFQPDLRALAGALKSGIARLWPSRG